MPSRPSGFKKFTRKERERPSKILEDQGKEPVNQVRPSRTARRSTRKDKERKTFQDRPGILDNLDRLGQPLPVQKKRNQDTYFYHLDSWTGKNRNLLIYLLYTVNCLNYISPDFYFTLSKLSKLSILSPVAFFLDKTTS